MEVYSNFICCSVHFNSGYFICPLSCSVLSSNVFTGVFTAPVRGVYHFVVFVFGHGQVSTSTGVTLHKNGEQVFLAYSRQPDHAVSPSNGASLLLEKGDVIYLKLWPNSWIHDTQNHHNTFSGHLLFPM